MREQFFELSDRTQLSKTKKALTSNEVNDFRGNFKVVKCSETVSTKTFYASLQNDESQLQNRFFL